jgi:hypothetical protein
VGVSRRGRFGWSFAIVAVSATAAWAAEAPLERVALLEEPRPQASVAEYQLRARWLVDARAGDDHFYSLEDQVAYFVAHAPTLVVRIPESPGGRASPRIELATLEVHLPF